MVDLSPGELDMVVYDMGARVCPAPAYTTNGNRGNRHSSHYSGSAFGSVIATLLAERKGVDLRYYDLAA